MKNISKNKSVLISIVIPVYRGAKTIGKLTDELILTLKKYRLEIVLINDGSPDNSHEVCLDQVKKYPSKIKYLSLSRNFGEHNAVMAGLNHATGDYAVIIDDDFQNPPEEIEKLVKKAIDEKLDVAYSYYAKKQHSFFRNLGSNFNNRIASFLLNKPRDFYLSSFKCLNQFTIKEIIKYTGPFPYIDGLIWRSTKKIGRVLVRHQKRIEGESGYNFKKLLKLYLNMFVNFSIYPLRISTVLGFFFSLMGVLLTVYFIIDKIIHPGIPLGITTIIVLMLTVSGIQMLMLGLIGEYLGQMLLANNQTPQFIVRYFYNNNENRTH
jgi:undecaprenyl-phosphate 4-deoxy-4-formamido-L-arabinose transferase